MMPYAEEGLLILVEYVTPNSAATHCREDTNFDVIVSLVANVMKIPNFTTSNV